MAKVHSVLSSQASPARRSVILTLALFGAMVPFTVAQQTAESPASTEALLTLPDSSCTSRLPRSSPRQFQQRDAGRPRRLRRPGQWWLPGRLCAPRVKLVAAHQIAPPQTASDKVVMGLREAVTPYSMIGWVFSAGWAQLIDGSPNYGTNSRAFAQRLGASAALAASRGIFTDSILAPVFPSGYALLSTRQRPQIYQSCDLRWHSSHHRQDRQRPQHPELRFPHRYGGVIGTERHLLSRGEHERGPGCLDVRHLARRRGNQQSDQRVRRRYHPVAAPHGWQVILPGFGLLD